MAGGTLTTLASMQCPHGGAVLVTPTGPRVRAAGAPVATAADTFTVAGCPFTLPTTPPTPSPCVLVRWTVADARNKSGGVQPLSQSSQGVCYSAAQVPQGPVVIAATQPVARTQ
jgi:hypothetical protein